MAQVPEEPTRRKAYIMSVHFYELMSKVLLHSAIYNFELSVTKVAAAGSPLYVDGFYLL